MYLVSVLSPPALKFIACLGLLSRLVVWTLFAPAWTIACVPGLPLLSSPMDIVHRSKTMPVFTWVLICLALYIPVWHLFDPACVLTMSINKSFHMDPHASRLVGSVTAGVDCCLLKSVPVPCVNGAPAIVLNERKVWNMHLIQSFFKKYWMYK